MDLNTYLSRDDAIGAADLARHVGASPALVYQWRTGRRPVPVKWCAAIEKATGGAVTRQDLRPDDYWEIWPELPAPFPQPAQAA